MSVGQIDPLQATHPAFALRALLGDCADQSQRCRLVAGIRSDGIELDARQTIVPRELVRKARLFEAPAALNNGRCSYAARGTRVSEFSDSVKHKGKNLHDCESARGRNAHSSTRQSWDLEPSADGVPRYCI
jgi:hypothetical protein